MPHEIAASAEDAVKQLELEVERRREHLSDTLRTLRTELHEVSQWRGWYERHTLAFLATAAAAGWLTGRLIFASDDD